MVVGASVIKLLKKRSYTIEELYQTLQDSNKMNLERFYNILSFLWTVDVIDFDKFSISLKNQNVSK